MWTLWNISNYRTLDSDSEKTGFLCDYRKNVSSVLELTSEATTLCNLNLY